MVDEEISLGDKFPKFILLETKLLKTELEGVNLLWDFNIEGADFTFGNNDLVLTSVKLKIDVSSFVTFEASKLFFLRIYTV